MITCLRTIDPKAYLGQGSFAPGNRVIDDHRGEIRQRSAAVTFLPYLPGGDPRHRNGTPMRMERLKRMEPWLKRSIASTVFCRA